MELPSLSSFSSKKSFLNYHMSASLNINNFSTGLYLTSLLWTPEPLCIINFACQGLGLSDSLIESFINLFIHLENNWERSMSQTVHLDSFSQQHKIIKASLIPGIMMDFFFPLSFANSNDLSNQGFRPWGWNRIKTQAPTMKIMHVTLAPAKPSFFIYLFSVPKDIWWITETIAEIHIDSLFVNPGYYCHYN